MMTVKERTEENSLHSPTWGGFPSCTDKISSKKGLLCTDSLKGVFTINYIVYGFPNSVALCLWVDSPNGFQLLFVATQLPKQRATPRVPSPGRRGPDTKLAWAPQCQKLHALFPLVSCSWYLSNGCVKVILVFSLSLYLTGKKTFGCAKGRNTEATEMCVWASKSWVSGIYSWKSQWVFRDDPPIQRYQGD